MKKCPPTEGPSEYRRIFEQIEIKEDPEPLDFPAFDETLI